MCGSEIKVEYLPVGAVTEYEHNARKHSDTDVAAIVASIRELGFNDPIGIWSKDNVIVEGHGRLMAAKELGMTFVPCIRLDHLTDEQRRAYALAHNKTAELSEWDFNVLEAELLELADIDMGELGFNGESIQTDWFQERERFDTRRQEGNEEYNDFLDKFEQPKTTDDCYTPDKVYDAVAEWTVSEYGVDRLKFVRPFYPGGNYQKYKYPDDCVVVDNPPFSILSEILKFYDENGIQFFLFAPALTLFSSSADAACAIGVGVGILYENGAVVSTSFLTNLEDSRFRTAPTLYKAVQEAVDEIRAEQRTELIKNDYPNCVVTSTKLSYLSKYGIDYKVSRDESKRVRQLDEQKESGKAIYGSGYFVSEKAAAEKAAAEKAAALKWTLSERELAIVASLGAVS